MDTAICFKLIVTTLIIELFTTNQAAITGLYDKNIAPNVKTLAVPLVCQFFSSKYKQRIAFHFRHIMREFCHSGDV